MAEKHLLAYCGIYCGDCLGYTHVIADPATQLKAVLEHYQFARTAAHVFPEQLSDYARFEEILDFLNGARCPARCRTDSEEQIAESCPVRRCCRERGYFACHECAEMETCDALQSQMGGLHGAACLANLRAIRDMGLEAWLASGTRHHYWDADESAG